jgi:hypothetical protein
MSGSDFGRPFSIERNRERVPTGLSEPHFTEGRPICATLSGRGEALEDDSVGGGNRIFAIAHRIYLRKWPSGRQATGMADITGRRRITSNFRSGGCGCSEQCSSGRPAIPVASIYLRPVLLFRSCRNHNVLCANQLLFAGKKGTTGSRR